MSDYLNISLKLHKEKDHELIRFLDGKPKSWIIKEALKTYMNVSNIDTTAKAVKEIKEEHKKSNNDAADVLGKFNIGG